MYKFVFQDAHTERKLTNLRDIDNNRENVKVKLISYEERAYIINSITSYVKISLMDKLKLVNKIKWIYDMEVDYIMDHIIKVPIRNNNKIELVPVTDYFAKSTHLVDTRGLSAVQYANTWLCDFLIRNISFFKCQVMPIISKEENEQLKKAINEMMYRNETHGFCDTKMYYSVMTKIKELTK